MFPYNISRVQQLRPHDLFQRKQFSAWCLQNLRSDPNFLRRIVFSDECVFHVSGIASNKNARFWGAENPRLVLEHQLHSATITVWCGIHVDGVLDPCYFENETVRGADYYELLNTDIRSSMHSLPQTICSNRM